MTTASPLNYRKTACPECRNPMIVEHNHPGFTIAEFVIEHRVLSANRFDPTAVTVTAPDEPSSKWLAREACKLHAARYGDDVSADDLTARETRREVHHAEREMACTVCTHRERING